MSEVYKRTLQGWILQEAYQVKPSASGTPTWETISSLGFPVAVTLDSSTQHEVEVHILDDTKPIGSLTSTIHTATFSIGSGIFRWEPGANTRNISIDAISGGLSYIYQPHSGWSELVGLNVTGPGTVTMTGNVPCLVKGTMITMADHTYKPIEKIQYGDQILAWNCDDGRFDNTEPFVIIEGESDDYNLLTFDDGTQLKTVIDHRIFDYTKQRFNGVYAERDTFSIGDCAFTDEGKTPKLISIEVIKEHITYYNIVTKRHYNMFTNGILTSCRLNNLYPIQNMKYVKDGRENIPYETRNDHVIPKWAYDTMRVGEYRGDINAGNVNHGDKNVEEYVARCLQSAGFWEER